MEIKPSLPKLSADSVNSKKSEVIWNQGYYRSPLNKINPSLETDLRLVCKPMVIAGNNPSEFFPFGAK
jgi:hypothetical protein